MQKITTVLVLLALSACGEEPCPDGQTRIGSACVNTLRDSGTADSGVDANELDASELDVGYTDSGPLDAWMDVCIPTAEMCNGVTDDCDDNIDEGACDFPNTEATCEPGGCEVVSCNEGFLDCSEGGGCETSSDRMNCGECGLACGATESCEAGRCVEHTLDWWWTVGPSNEVRIASGLDQRYMLVPARSGGVELTPSNGSPITFGDDGLLGFLLVALDDNGAALWQVRLSGNIEAVALRSIPGVDGVFVAGNFRGSLVADGPGTDVARDNAGTRDDAFVLQIDQSGSVRLVHHITDIPGNDERQVISSMDVSTTGQVFVTGTSVGDFRQRNGFSSGLTEVPSGVFTFILGSEALVTPMVGASWENLAVDDEHLYVSTRIEESGVVELGGEEYSGATGNAEPLIACFDHDLALQWVQTPLEAGGGVGDDYPHYLHAGDGSVVIGQHFGEHHNFGGHMVSGGGFIASLSPTNGVIDWVREIGDSAPAVHAAEGQVYFAGSGSSTIDLGGGSLGTAVGTDATFGVLEANGNYESARRFGGLSADSATAVQPTSSGIMLSGLAGAMTVDGTMFNRGRFVFHFSTE